MRTSRKRRVAIQPGISIDLPVLSFGQKNLEEGSEDDTFGFRVEAYHLGDFRFTPGEIFFFSTAREVKPGDDVVVFLLCLAVDPTSREPVGHYEKLIIRKLIYATDMSVVLGPSPGTEGENETIPRDRIKGVYPWIASAFP